MIRRLVPLALAALVLVPRAASALVSVEVFYGLSRPGAADFRAATSGAANDPNLLKSSLQIAGGNAILDLGLLELGAIVDTSFKSGSASQTALGALAGLGFDFGPLRLQALGEIGGQRYGNFLENREVITASSKEEWLMYVGLRPGLAYRADLAAGFGVIIGVWGFVRWDLTSKDVPVNVRSGTSTSPGTLELGGTTIGAVARLGIDF